MPQKNLALELLRKLLNDEIKTRARHNAVQARSFGDLLEATIKRYQNRTIDTAEVITNSSPWPRKCARPASAARN